MLRQNVGNVACADLSAEPSDQKEIGSNPRRIRRVITQGQSYRCMSDFVVECQPGSKVNLMALFEAVFRGEPYSEDVL